MMGRKPKILLLNGKENTVKKASLVIGCQDHEIYQAIYDKAYWIRGYSVCWANDIHDPVIGYHKRRILLVDEIPTTVHQACKDIGRSDNAIYTTIKRGVYCISGHTICWQDDPHEANPQIGCMRPCVIDDVLFKSAASAAREYGFSIKAFYQALNQSETFRGHSIAWADEE
jgi:hypothetical protein